MEAHRRSTLAAWQHALPTAENVPAERA
jgi:hypothetical protein